MSKYHNDQPIKGSDQDPDLLNRSNFASNLANVLLLDYSEDCLTISLEGEWGYGKTSVINLVKRAIKERAPSSIIVEYNPWLAGKPESLIQDFLLQFSYQLNITDNSKAAARAAEELISYSSLFGVAKLVPGAEPWASITEKVFSKLGKATKDIAGLKKLDLLGKKQKVGKAIAKIKEPIVVIIDDIDRLTPSETFQVLRLVKAVADFTGTSFLLAFDSKYLVSVLEKNSIENAFEYINKIVQLRVPLPIISDEGINELAQVELTNLSEKNLTNVFERDDERLSWVYHRYFKQLIKNPRELKRFFNHLRFVLEQVEGQVCFADLFALSIIATKAAKIYEHLKKVPEAYLLTGLTKQRAGFADEFDETDNPLQNERKQLLETIEPRDRKLIKGILEVIFPKINPSGFDHFSTASTDAAGRVSAPQRLYIALHYMTPKNFLSDQEALNFIHGLTDRIEFLKTVVDTEYEERFFEMMNNYSSQFRDDSFDILVSICTIFLDSHRLKNSMESNYGIFSRDPFRELIWLTINVISEHKNKAELIEKMIKRVENAPVSTDILRKLREQHRGGGKHWISVEKLSELEKAFQSVAIKALHQKMFLDNHLESHIFFGLKHSSSECASKVITDILKEENGIIRVAEIIGYCGSDSSNGPYACIDERTFGDVLDFDDIKNKAAAENLSQHPISIQATLKSMLNGQQYYLRDCIQKDW